MSETTALFDNVGNISRTTDDRPLIGVLKGFPHVALHGLTVPKALDFPVGVSLQELHEAKPRLLPEVLSKLLTAKGSILWCTYEEYITISPDIWNLYADVSILKNNLYHNLFPSIYTIPYVEEIYQRFYDDDPVEIKRDAEIEMVQNYYGDLVRVGNQFFVSYALESEDSDVFACDGGLSQEDISVYDEAAIELTDNEENFLALIDDIRAGRYDGQEVRVSFSGTVDMFPNRYLERLSALLIAFPQVELTLCTKRLEQKNVITDQPYKEILKKYWGYDEFRDLKMYANVNDSTDKKRTILVPQSQIIDDLVTQSVHATQGEAFQDVFVTSPTGAGKSLMFQIPAIYLAEKYNLMTIVISPLIGLMFDQVQGLQSHNVEISATINSEITPFEKADIAEGIAEGKISILYISPETLLSRSDITQLIGNRKIGLFVIDEAHIVTTWGKAFRSDYWYLGSYLQRLRKDMKFPVATFTATAIYGGIEDMYAETRDSLNMINPISYFGYVKRDDLLMKLKRKINYATDSKFNDYLQDKFDILLARLEAFVQRGQKTLVYFPVVTLIQRFLAHAQTFGSPELNRTLAYYYGPLKKEDKSANYMRFKNNDSIIMLATKAFGMGIDIPDILNVYHFAPTGNVCDYIQEIGRAARALPEGNAYFDYLPKDFVHVNRLHGISTLQKRQLVQVIEKVLNVVEASDSPRSILISPDEFRHIFERRQGEDEDIDNKLKTALLIIEKDFKAKLGYSPLVARPRSLFAMEYFLVQRDTEEFMKSTHSDFVRLVRRHPTKKDNVYSGVYALDMKKLWESQYRSMSFPYFKFRFHSKDDGLGLDFLSGIQPVLKVELDLHTPNIEGLRAQIARGMQVLATVFGDYARTNKYFSIDDVANKLADHMSMNKYARQSLASLLVMSAERYDGFLKRNSNFYNRFMKYDENRGKYQITSGYSNFTNWIISESNRLFSQPNMLKLTDSQYEYYMPRNKKDQVEKTFILLGVLEALELLMYRVNGGDYPEIFVRIHSLMQLQRVVKNPVRYENYILSNVYKRHQTSVEMLTYLFENPFSTEEFWDKIEDYFLGELPIEVIGKLKQE